MRGKSITKRPVKADPVYHSELVGRLINAVMLDGKKALATSIIYTILETLDVKSADTKKKVAPLEVLETAIENVKPRLEIKSRRVGGANYQVPVPVPVERQLALAMRWMINAARESRKKTTFAESFRLEIEAAYHNQGQAIRKKEDTHRMAEANKAFAQFS